MINGIRVISPAIFGLAVICFLLPFVSVSCQGQKVVTFTGLELATGSTYQQPGMFGAAQSRKVEPEPLAALALLIGVIGFGLSFIRNKNILKANVIAGIAGFVFLMLLRFKLDNDAAKEGILQIGYEIGFWIASLLYLSAVIAAVVFISQRHKLDVTSNVISKSIRYCGSCGAQSEPGSQFCGSCGSKVVA